MATLATIEDKQDFISDDITIPADGPVQVFVRGQISTYGRVYVQIKHGSVYQSYPELSVFGYPAAVQAEMKAGDIVRVVVEQCRSVDVEVRQ